MKHRKLKRSRSFTLVELGIVVGVIAILSTIVLAGSGFIEAARIGNAAVAQSGQTRKKAAGLMVD